MTISQTPDPEAHGEAFSLASMRYAQQQSWTAVRRIAEAMRPGLKQSEAVGIAARVLEQLGMDRIWHPTLVRFGEDTLKIFRESSDPDAVLGESDIFFVDIGPVWDGHEGDAGDTFVVGDDARMRACAEAARTLWSEVSERWRRDGLAGTELYRFAAQRAEEMGWRLNLDIKGHRVCDFPHALYKAGSLGDFGRCPTTGLWVLEIQIADPSRPFGAFYEDLLFADELMASAPEAA
ncbi:MAG: M24 family metallopeptidase [Burkholderiaceae bacterium]